MHYYLKLHEYLTAKYKDISHDQKSKVKVECLTTFFITFRVDCLTPALHKNTPLATFKTKLNTYLFRRSQRLSKTIRRCCGVFAISAPRYVTLLTYLLTYCNRYSISYINFLSVLFSLFVQTQTSRTDAAIYNSLLVSKAGVQIIILINF